MRHALFLALLGILIAAPVFAQSPEPILYYSFDKGTVSCIGGEPVTDLSGSGYDGTLTSNTALTVGTFGNSLYFDAGRYIDVGLPVFSTTDAFQPYTISFWIKTNQEAGGGFVTQYSSGNTLALGDGQPFQPRLRSGVVDERRLSSRGPNGA